MSGQRRRKIVAGDPDSGLIAMIDMLRNYGARTLWCGFSLEGQPVGRENDDNPADPGPDVPVVWWMDIEWGPDALANWRRDEGDRPIPTLGKTDPITDHMLGPLKAGADLMRQLGANVTIIEDRSPL